MFPTAGYFKGVECPFYKEGACHRPYCHYKHAKLRVQPIVRQPTRFPHTSTSSGKITKSEVKHQYAPQQSTSDNSNNQQEVTSLPACAVDSQPADVKINDQEEKQSKHDTPVSYSQMTGGSNPDVSQSGSLYTQSRTTTSSDVKEQCASESECPNKKDNISVEESHHRHITTNTTAEVQGSPIMVSQSHSDNIHAFTVMCEPQEIMSSIVTPPAVEHKAEHAYINTSVLPVSHTNGSDEVLSLQDEALYKEADENTMFEELFGSSGEEDHKEEDDVIEGAVYDYGDDDMELGDHREIDQRKVEEEFKRITTSSTGLPHTAVPKRSYENLGIKNKRQAYSNAELLRHGGVTVGRPKAKTTSSMNPLLSDPSAIYAGKKRKAHGQGGSSSDVTTAPAPKRPRLLVSVNAKIPTALRQNYLDSFIDEYLKFCHAEEAYKKGLDDEQALFKKANNKMLYMNLSSIALKRLREKVSKERPCSPIISSSETKKTSPPVSKRHSTNTVSSTTSNRAPVQEKKAKKAEVAEPPPGTYYLDEIFKTTVNMEMHQKDKPHSGTNHDSAGIGNLETSSDSIVSNKDHHDNRGKEKSTSKAKRPLSFDSALQKIDRKLMSKRERPRAGSPSVKKQIGSSKIFPSSQQSTKGTEHEEVQSLANSPTNPKPTSVQVQKLIDRGFAKVKTKSSVEQSHSTNRISLTSNRLVKSSANVSKGPSLAGQHTEQTDKLKKKSVRQIFVNKSSPLTSPTSESVSSTSAATGPTISAAQFYSSKVSKQGKIKINIKSNPTSISVPASKTEKHSSSPNYSILKKKEVLLTDEIFIQYMNSYLLTEAQLVENGYPRPTGEPGVASIVRKPDDVSDIKPVGPNAQRHTCCRCGKPFVIYNSGSYQSTEECCYHFKRLQKKKEYGEGVISYYPCCQGNRGSSGCQIAKVNIVTKSQIKCKCEVESIPQVEALIVQIQINTSIKMHVTKGAKPPLESGYVQTGRHPNMNNYTPTVYALDCEMCYTTAGLELTRVSVVGTNNESVYESLVKPAYPVVDYNTKFSGITAQDLALVTTTLQDVQNNLLNLFYEDTILLGHSLESDLQSLKIIHSCVVDTALVFPHRMGLPYKRALRNITAEFLHKIIQDEVDGGHDSKEDAIACMDLMKWKIKSDLQKTTRRGSVT